MKSILFALLMPLSAPDFIVSIETPTHRYMMQGCSVDTFFSVRYGTRFEAYGSCMTKPMASPQAPGWTPSPHPDGIPLAFDGVIHFAPAPAFTTCTMIDFRHSGGVGILMAECI